MRLSTPEDTPQSPAEVERHLSRVSKTAKRIWYLRVFETVTDRASVVHNWLDRNLIETEMRWYPGMDYLQLYRYAPQRPGPFDLPADVKPVELTFQNGAALVGYRLPSSDLRPGDTTVLDLYWQARSAIARDYQVYVHLLDHERRLVAQSDGPPLNGRYPTGQWKQGESVADSYALRLPDSLAPGVYTVLTGMYELSTMQRELLSQGGDSAQVAQLVVHPTAPPSTDETALARFGPIELVRFAVESEVAAGRVGVALRWKAIEKPAADYKVFLHLLAEDGQMIAQEDREPMRGAFPTSKWHPGDRVDDQYTLTIPSDIASRNYRIALGFYDPQTLLRVASPGHTDGRVLLGPYLLGPSQ